MIGQASSNSSSSSPSFSASRNFSASHCDDPFALSVDAGEFCDVELFPGLYPCGIGLKVSEEVCARLTSGSAIIALEDMREKEETRTAVGKNIANLRV